MTTDENILSNIPAPPIESNITRELAEQVISNEQPDPSNRYPPKRPIKPNNMLPRLENGEMD